MAPRRTAQVLDARMAPQTICCLCRMAQTQPCGCVAWGLGLPLLFAGRRPRWLSRGFSTTGLNVEVVLLTDAIAAPHRIFDLMRNVDGPGSTVPVPWN